MEKGLYKNKQEVFMNKIRKEIDKYAKDSNKNILHKLFDNYSRESQWRFVAYCTFERYGKLSYQVNRIWHPTKEGIVLYKHLLLEQ